VGQPVGDHELNKDAAEHAAIESHPTSLNHTNDEGEATKPSTNKSPSDQATTEALPEQGVRLAEWRRLFLAALRFDERLKLLVDFGLTDHDIATAIPNTKTRSVRRWRAEGAPSKRPGDRWAPIDDLCAIIGFFLADGSFDEESIVSWLRSRQMELGNRRPLEVIEEGDFDAVLAAAENSLRTSAATDEELLSLPRRADSHRIPARQRRSG
jgi:hypothetical protein